MKRTAIFIREYLKNKGEAYIHEMWKAFRSYCIENGYTPPTRQSFGNYVYLLRRLGLIRLVRKARGDRSTERHYYSLNLDKVDDEAWRDPMKFLGYRRSKISYYLATKSAHIWSTTPAFLNEKAL